MKFQCDKLIQALSQDHPEAVVPVFERIAAHLKHPNHFIQWGALLTLPNLIPCDRGEKFMKITPIYIELMDCDSMITAANAAKGLLKLIPFHPELEQTYVAHLMACENRTYLDKNTPSPECRNIMISHAIDLLSQRYASSAYKIQINAFMLRQIENPRPGTAKKAKSFLTQNPQ